MRQRNYAVGRDVVGGFNIQTYLDVKTIAAISKWACENGDIKKAVYSQVLSTVVSVFAEVYADELYEFETVEEAVNWLGEHGFSLQQFAESGWNRKALQKSYAKEAVMADFGETTYNKISQVKTLRPNKNKVRLGPLRAEDMENMEEAIQNLEPMEMVRYMQLRNEEKELVSSEDESYEDSIKRANRPAPTFGGPPPVVEE